MNFKIELDEKYCTLKENNEACPFVAMGGKRCFVFEKEININKNIDEYVRCPECLAEEKKQLTVEDCEITEHPVEGDKEHACLTEGACDLQDSPNAPCRNAPPQKGCPIGSNEVYKRRSK
jgi:hypothetical protein